MGRLFTVWGYIRKYKYVAATIIFLLIIGVLDENSLWVRFHRRVEIANTASFPPVSPVSEITLTFICPATIAARQQSLALPEVEIHSSTSPSFPSPITCCA